MEKRVANLLTDYVSKCARCLYRRTNECGYSDTSLVAPELSQEDFESMFPVEQMLHRTQEMHIPCDNQMDVQQLIEKVDAIIDESNIPLRSSWLLSYFTKLAAVKEKVRKESGKFESAFLPRIDDVITHIIAKIDLAYLKNGHDISYFLGLVDRKNNRIKHLDSVCPHKIVEHYLKLATPLEGYTEQNEVVPDTNPSDAERLVKKLKSEFGVSGPRFPNRSASYELKSWMREQRNVALVEMVLCEFGYGDLVGDPSFEKYDSKQGSERLQEWMYTDFGRWDELKKEIFDIAERNRDNQTILERTLGKQVEACSSLARYCYPPADAPLIEKEAAVVLKLLSNASFPGVVEAVKVWDTAKQEAFQLSNPETDQVGYLDALYRLSVENSEELKCDASPFMLVCAGRARAYMKRLAIYIESALFRFCPTLRLSKMEQSFNISISDGVSEDEIFHELGWQTSKEREESDRRYIDYSEETPDNKSGVSSGSSGKLVKDTPPADLPLCGVDEVDNLGYYYFQAAAYNELKAQDDRDNFRKLCYSKAEDKTLSEEDKKIWIMRVLQTIDTAYALTVHGDKNEQIIEHLARQLAVVLECSFMAVANPICVKRIGMENDLSLVFRFTIDWDKDHPLTDVEIMTRFYEVQGEVGGNIVFFERQMCLPCDVKSCPYRLISSKGAEMVLPDDCPDDHVKNVTAYGPIHKDSRSDDEEDGGGGDGESQEHGEEEISFAELGDPISHAENYLKALYPAFVDEQFKWKKESATNYHAYWAAKIINCTFQEIKIDSVGELFGINSLRTYGSQAKKREGVKSAIINAFKNANLTLPTGL